MSTFYEIKHPLVQNKVARLRDKTTGHKEFREITKEISTLLCYEATKHLPLRETSVESKNGIVKSMVLDTKISIVPILREGLGMLDGVLELVPNAKVGHIGLYRDPETFMSVEYYCKLPKNIEDCEIFLLDACIATGGNVCSAISFMKERNAKKITVLTIIAAPDGIKHIQTDHPDVDIYAAAYDPAIDKSGYVFPGLGDAGDRLYGTK